MFDTPNNGALVGGLVRNYHIAQANADAAASWRAKAEQLEVRVRELELALAVKTAHAGGLAAFLDAFKQASPTSPVLADSGKRFRKTGAVKTKGSLIYSEAFDRIARDNGIPVPTEYRTD